MSDDSRRKDDKRPELIGVAVAFIFLTVFTLTIRTYTQLRILKSMTTDGSAYTALVLILFAGALAIGLAVFQILEAQSGLGRHVEFQTPEMAVRYIQYSIGGSMCYSSASTFIKASLLVFYLRLSVERSFRVLVYVMLFINIAFGIASCSTVLLQCIPLHKLWHPDSPGTCIKNIVTFYFANAVINIVTDIIIYIMPMPMLWGLKLPRRQRVGLVGLFGLGGLVCAAGTVRLANLRAMLGSKDPSWTTWSAYNWSTIEMNLAIFIACAPSSKAFINHYMPGLLGSTRGSSSNAYEEGCIGGSIRLASNKRQAANGPISELRRTTGGGTANMIYSTKKGTSESEETIILPQHGSLVGRATNASNEAAPPDKTQSEVTIEPC